MYIEVISFEEQMPIAFDAYKAGRYHLHCHEGVIEVLMVLNGSAKVKVSFEQFDMKEGDYAVIKDGDSHSIYATDSKCQIACLYFNIADYRAQIPYLDYIFFACESFDLAKYRNETYHLRKLISSTILNLAQDTENSRKEAKKIAEELLWIFVNDYDLKNYYSRNWDAGYSKTEKYHKIMKYIFEYYEMKDLQEYISKNEFYSKSYITHLFKDVGASSFQDVLTYIRLYKSEKILLTTDLPLADIANDCGFSDIKYYTKNFKKWFLCTPSEYRKKYQPEVLKNTICQRLTKGEIIGKMQGFIKYTKDDTEYRAAVNPLTLKTWGAEDTMAQNEEAEGEDLFLKVGNAEEMKTVLEKFSSFCTLGFRPRVSINFPEVSLDKCREIFNCCRELVKEEKRHMPEFQIFYYNIEDKRIVEQLICDGRSILEGAIFGKQLFL